MIDNIKITEFLNENILIYSELLEFEKQKLDMIYINDVDSISKALGKEQALIMKTNALEKKRISEFLKDNENRNLREIIESCPQEDRNSLNKKHEELSKIINEIKTINNQAQEVVSKKINLIEKHKIGVTADTYNFTGTKTHYNSNNNTINKNI